ncbi:MAG TPA: peptidoglycan editing factor PgeF [Rheinheimera sp.]|nr:peptidoglycan editing factor PgeF [Rheinheimera sp.]
MSECLLTPNWPAPPNVRAVFSTRDGGCSEGCYASLNLGEHVADEPHYVAENRRRFRQLAQMPAEPVWLQQVHGTTVLPVDHTSAVGQQADASVTSLAGVVCTVMTADCLPLLLCDAAGSQVAAVHAGWRGLCDGIIEQTLAQFARPGQVLAYLGPAISQSAFEVGSEVREAFVARAAEAQQAFIPGKRGKWQADLYLLARQRLQACGVQQIYGGNYCTYQQNKLFFSYRRDGQTGRMASSIWLVWSKSNF